MTFRYRLIDEDGADLGPLASYRSEWQPGERLSRWHGERLEVVSVVEADELRALPGLRRRQAAVGAPRGFRGP